MTRTIVSLLFLLTVQCALLAILYWPDQGEVSRNAELLDPAAALQVDTILLQDAMDNSVRIERARGRWVLPELQHLPADGARVQALLDTLSKRPRSFPVADSVAARQRFRVASYHFQRKLVFMARGETLATVFFGRSPAYRKVYARNESADDIYSLQYEHHDAAASPDAWLDGGLASIREPRWLQVDDVILESGPQGQWRSLRGGRPEPAELGALLEILDQLTVRGLASEDTQRSLAEAPQPSRTLRARQGERTVVLELFEFDRQYFLHDSRHSPFFRLSRRQYQRLMAIDTAKLAGRPLP